MHRKTKKYLRGIRLLGLPQTVELPHQAVYGLLAVRGYQWDGKDWQRAPELSRQHESASVRITANEPYAERLALTLIDFFDYAGMETHKLSGPYPSRNSTTVRYYLHMTFPPDD